MQEAYWKDHPYQGNWNRVVDLIQSCFREQQVPSQISWQQWNPGAIRGWCLIEGYKRGHEGTGETYSKRKGKRTVCPVTSCGKALALSSLQSHLRTQHRMDACGSIIIKPIALAPCLYKLSFKRQAGYSRRVPCPVENCQYTVETAANL